LSEDKPTVVVPDMCQKHQSLMIHQTGFKEADPWRALVIVSQIALFQAATCDNEVHKKIDGDITRIGELGCLACYKPDAFGEIIHVASITKTHALKYIKALGERWVKEGVK
jgi:hypothetical protein